MSSTEGGGEDNVKLAFPVYFAAHRADLEPQELLVLDQIAEVMKRFPRVTAVVTGYRDSQQDGLASQREQYTLHYLATKSIATERLTAAEEPWQIAGERGRVDLMMFFPPAAGLASPAVDGDGDGKLVMANATSRPGVARRLPQWPQDAGFAPLKTEFQPLAQSPQERQSVPAAAPASGLKTDEYLSFTEKAGYPEYKLGPDDVLEVTLKTKTQALEEKYLLTVKPDGTVSIPFIQPIKVGGLTLQETEETVAQKLAGLYREVWVNVSIKEYQSYKVLVFGAVSQTKAFPLSGKTSLREIIATAGTGIGGVGVKPDLSRVTVRKQDGRLFVVDLTLKEAPAENDFVVDARDVVFVPPAPEIVERVIVLGDVRAPGVYPLAPEMTPFEAIAKAGGYTDFAKLENTTVIRGDLSHPELLAVNTRKVLQGGALDAQFFLRNEDILYVPRTGFGNFYAKLKPIIDLISGPANILVSIIAIRQF